MIWHIYVVTDHVEWSRIFVLLQMAVGGVPTEGSSTPIEKETIPITSRQVACELPEKSGSYEVELVSGSGAFVASSRSSRNTKMTIISYDSVCYLCNPTGECSLKEVMFFSYIPLSKFDKS